MTTFSERLVNRLSDLGMRTRTDRRGFLTASAMVGTALAVNPWSYLTRPASAYDRVCGSGNLCADGWSVFCCTINGGKNQCPPGSFVGGWWKADNSGFCCGSARYYIDCNAYAGDSTWKCHCNTTTCDQRRVACNQFRYGQCNQQIGPYGPVVCRMVTCTPPWRFDPSCTTTSATDNATVTHSAPCLPGQCGSAIEDKYQSMGGPSGPLGKRTDGQHADGHGGRYELFEHGLIAWSSTTGAHALVGPIATKYRTSGGSNGVLKYPTSDTTARTGGVLANFVGGVVLWSSAYGAHISRGAILDRYRASGSTNGPLKYPMTDVVSITGGQYQRFAIAVILWSKATGAHVVIEPMLGKYRQLGGSGGRLGFPTSERYTVTDGLMQNYQHGRLKWIRATNTVVVL